jgi:parallel beta-helix repeat protein
MRKGFPIGVLIALVLAVGIGDALAKTLVVDDDLVQCPNADFTTPAGIQLAVNAAGPGDHIKVCPGNYTATTVDKPDLKLDGATKKLKDNECLDAAANPANDPTKDSVVHGGTNASGFRVVANDVTISGFTVEDASNEAGVNLSRLFSGYEIRDNVVQENTFGVYFNSNGVLASEVRKNCIRNNVVAGSASGNGIYSDQGLFNAEIDHNIFTGHSNASVILVGGPGPATSHVNVKIDHNDIIEDAPIIVVNAQNSEINHNRSVGSNGSGIFLGGGVTDSEIGHNQVEGCAFTGVNLRFDPVSYNVAAPNTENTIRNNDVTGCGDAGVRVRDGSNNTTVRNNKVEGNGLEGIGLRDGDNNVVQNNKSERNTDDGLYVDAASAGNRIENNHMRANTPHDCHDESTGTGTAGTANIWQNDKGDTQNRPGLCRGAAVTPPATHP